MTELSDQPALLDPVELRLQARSGGRSTGRLFTLVRSSLGLVWRANHRQLLVLAVLQIVAALLLAGQIVVVERVVSAVVDVAEGNARLGRVVIPLVVFAAFTAATGFVAAVQTTTGRRLGEAVARLTWRDVFAVTTAVTLRHFESPEFYNLVQRVQANATTRPFQVSQALLRMVGGLAATVGVGTVLISIHPLLPPLLVAGGLPLMLTNRAESRREFQFSVDQTPNQRERAYISHLLTGHVEAKEVRAFDLGQSLSGRHGQRHQEYERSLADHLSARLRLSLIGNLVSAIFLAATMVGVGWLIHDGQIGVGQAGAAIVAIRMLQTQLTTLLGGIQSIFEAGLFLDDIESFGGLAAQAADDEHGREVPSTFDRITIDDVHFRYPGARTEALRGVDLEIPHGSVVALVGENGSGKTTLAKVIAGLYDADSGAVRWDGSDTREMSRTSLRSQVAVIFQDFVRYAFTVRENIAAGDAAIAIDNQRVIAAASAAGAGAFITRLPDGYDTILSRLFRGGVDLSGGQWQRIAIARALYRDAPLIILDEPTSALDSRAEHELFTSLRSILADRTAVVVSHRFSTVRSADLIVVLHMGRMIESGTHDELMAKNGRYAELFRLQASTYISDVAI